MNGEIAPVSALADTKQPLVDPFTAIVYRFSPSGTVMIVLYWNGKRKSGKLLHLFLQKRTTEVNGKSEV